MLLTDPKIIQQTNMASYLKAVSTWLTSINTIIADGQISANSPLCTVTVLRMFADKWGSCDHNLHVMV